MTWLYQLLNNVSKDIYASACYSFFLKINPKGVFIILHIDLNILGSKCMFLFYTLFDKMNFNLTFILKNTTENQKHSYKLTVTIDQIF